MVYFIQKKGEYRRELSETGYEFGETFTRLYEAQIPPLLRMFHIRNISPSGWIELHHKSLIVHKKKLHLAHLNLLSILPI